MLKQYTENKRVNAEKCDKTVAVAICALLFFNTIAGFINNITERLLGLDVPYDTFLCYLIALLLLLKGIYKVREKRKLFISYYICFFLYGITLLFHPENAQYMFSGLLDVTSNAFYRLFIFAFPCYVLISSISELRIFVSVLYKASLVTTVALLIKWLLFADTFVTLNSYLTFSYGLVTPACFLLYDALTNNRKTSYVLYALSLFAIFLSGSRGALVCLICSMLLIVLFNLARKNRRGRYLGFATIFLSVMVVINFDKALIFIQTFFGKYASSSRTLSMINANSFWISQARKDIANLIIQSIPENAIFGTGLFGDRIISGQYVHNVVLEILVQFGVIFGGIILVILAWRIIKTLVVSKNRIQVNLVLVFISTGLLKLMFSGSYLNEPSFFLLVGLCMSTYASNELKQNNQNGDLKM